MNLPQFLWPRLDSVHGSITDPEHRRQSLLLARLLYVLIPLGGLALILKMWGSPDFLWTIVAISPAIMSLVVAYLLNRAGYVQTGAVLTVTVCLAAALSAMFINPHDQLAFAYLAIPLFLARLLLSERVFLLVGASSLSVVAMVLLTLLSDKLLAGMVMIYLATLLMLFWIAVRHRASIEHDRRKTLAASEQELRTILDNMQDTYYRTDMDGRVVRASASATKLLGYSPHEVLGRRLADFYVEPDGRERFLSALQASSGLLQDYEAPLRHRDGAVIWVSTNAQYLRDASGRVVGVEGTTRDITERRIAEARTVKLNKLLRMAGEIDAILVRESGRDTLLQEACRVMVEHGGFSMAWVGLADWKTGEVRPAAHAGRSSEYVYDIKVRCDDSQHGRGPFGRAMCEGRPVLIGDTESDPSFVPWRERARQARFRSVAAFPIRMGEQVIGAIGAYTDAPTAFTEEEVDVFSRLASNLGYALQASENVIQRRRAEEALRASEAHFRAVVSNAPVVLYTLDRNGIIQLSEGKGLAALQLRPGEVVGRSVFDMYRDYPEICATIRRALAGEALVHVVTLGSLTFEVHYSPTFGPDGRVDSVIGLAIDISERMRAELALKQSESNYRALTENANVGILVNYQGRHVFANPQLLEMLGYTADELHQTSIEDLVHPDEIVEVRRKFQDRLAGRPVPSSYETVLLAKDGTSVPVEITATLTTWLGEPAGLVFLHDIRERIRSETEMRKLSSAIAQTADAVMITDRQGNIEYVNPAFETMTGYSRADVLGARSNILKSGRQGETFYQRMWSTILAGEPFSDVLVNRRKDGSLYYEEKTITPLKDAYGTITHFVSTGRDITERMQTQEQLQYLAQHDALTELPNRVLLLDRLKQGLARARWHRRLVAVLFVDLDRFKTINDTLGHEVGDRLLQQLAERFRRSVREGDTVARFGGDEFVILLDDVANESDIAAIAKKVLETLAPPFEIDDQRLYITASIGISLYPNDGEDSGTLLKHADIAMYRAKELGKNTYQFFAADMSARAFERLSLETRLRHALDRGEFMLVYQPQVDVVSGRVVGVEALLRWQHPDFGLVLPGDFIASLEETGLIVPVGNWVMSTACMQLHDWRAAGHTDLQMAVNLSPRQLQSDGFTAWIKHALSAHDIPPGQLELEITENVLLRQAGLAHDALEGLRMLGVRLAIDDFGTGYSSLAYLQRFSIDTLKIDRSFVHDIPDDPDDSAITTAIAALARSLQLEMVAEGVETEAQREFLQSLGCTTMQGHLFSRPLPAEEVSQLLKKKVSGS